jgi:hypothetical protein
MFGRSKGRTKAMKAIDAAVAEWNQFWELGLINRLITAANKILTAINVWEGTKDDPDAAMRGDEVRRLKTETNQWLVDLRGWRDGYAARKTLHDQHRTTVNTWIDEGLRSQDTRLRNACEWVRSGKTRFFVVSETLDPKVRGAAITNKTIPAMPDDTRCYFPNPQQNRGGDLSGPPLYYNGASFRDATNVQVDEEGAGTKGWNRAGAYIVVTQEGVADGKDEVFGTLRHEVQHDADKNQGTELNAGVANAQQAKTTAEQRYNLLVNDVNTARNQLRLADTVPNRTARNQAELALTTFQGTDAFALRDEKVASETALRRYKTEYRAHFYQGDPTFDNVAHNPNRRVLHEGYRWTRRQWAIFQKIRDNYPYVERAWGDAATPPTALQTAYRNAVVAYWNPDTEGFNKYDSTRVDDLYTAMDLVPDGTSDVNNPAFKAVLKVVGQLKTDDIDYLQDATQSVMWQTKITRHLTGAALVAFRTELEEIKTGQAIASLFDA